MVGELCKDGLVLEVCFFNNGKIIFILFNTLYDTSIFFSFDLQFPKKKPTKHISCIWNYMFFYFINN